MDLIEKRYKKALTLAISTQKYSKKVHNALQKGVEQGHGPSMYALATWYLHGYGPIEVDVEAAVDLLEKAAAQAQSSAWYDLAVCYELGVGKKKSFAEAFRCYIMSSALGDRKAIFEAGRLLYHRKLDLNSVRTSLRDNLLDVANVLGLYQGEE